MAQLQDGSTGGSTRLIKKEFDGSIRSMKRNMMAPPGKKKRKRKGTVNDKKNVNVIDGFYPANYFYLAR
jgi:hypothetical protein